MTTHFDITGVESVVFGVEDIDECRRFFEIYGLTETVNTGDLSVWEALDGSSIELRRVADPALPPAVVPGSTGRRYVWGVRNASVLEAIAAELRGKRPMAFENGEVTTVDNDGHTLTFRVSRRRPYEAESPKINIEGAKPQRAVNERVAFRRSPKARALGHVVYWSKDPAKSMEFYLDTLGFRITDGLRNNGGAFIRAHGHHDHHSAFFINLQDRPFQASLQHVEFAFADMHEVLMVGDSLTRAGFKTGFGPGRHELGSNWYWYFITPMGCAFEIAADIDLADENWVPGMHDSLNDVVGWSLAYTGMSGTEYRDQKLAAGEKAV